MYYKTNDSVCFWLILYFYVAHSGLIINVRLRFMKASLMKWSHKAAMIVFGVWIKHHPWHKHGWRMCSVDTVLHWPLMWRHLVKKKKWWIILEYNYNCGTNGLTWKNRRQWSEKKAAEIASACTGLILRGEIFADCNEALCSQPGFGLV